MKAILLISFLIVFSSAMKPVRVLDELKAYFTIIDNILETIRGTLNAFNDGKEDVQKLLLCVNGFHDMETKVDDIIEVIKHLQFTDISKLIESIMQIFNDVKLIIKDFDPCFDSGKEIIVIIKKLFQSGLMESVLKVFKNLTHNGPRIYDDVMTLIDVFVKHLYYDIGYKSGDLFWVLMLKVPE